MRQRQNRNQSGYDYQPVQQGEVEEEGPGEPVSRRRYEGPMAAGSPRAESSSAAVRRGKQKAVSVPDEETHPALMDDPDVISHAI